MSDDGLRILILGGYGVFGGRLAKLLADEPRLTLIIAGRSRAKAEVFCASFPSQATLISAIFNREADITPQLPDPPPHVIVDATGPFQRYGDDPYRVVKAAIACGADYMDLADGSDFVHGIGQFDAEAKQRGVYVLSGVSSFPVLTAAVVRRLAAGLDKVEHIIGGIAPSPYAGVGLNVIRAIANYAGQPVKLLRDGRNAIGYGLTENMRYTIAPPGMLPLRNIRFSLVDVPDLQILPQEWPGLKSIWMGAGPVPEILHRMLNGLAWLVKLKWLPTLAPLGGLFHCAINNVRWGEHRGGMFVSVDGAMADGREVTRSWHLLAEGDDGPFIPSMAVEAIIRNSLSGKRPGAGARPGTKDLELEDYDRLFARRTIYTGFRDDTARQTPWPLYRRILGDSWAQLPEPIKRMHEPKGMMTASGIATVERGSGIIANLIAGIFGFPRTKNDIPVTVTFTTTREGEKWRRDFDGHKFSSFQSEGAGRFDRLIVERFGPFHFGLALVVEGARLILIPRRWTFLGIPMPLPLIPRGNSYETVEDGRFHFNVEIELPLIGQIVRYRGWLIPDADIASNASEHAVA